MHGNYEKKPVTKVSFGILQGLIVTGFIYYIYQAGKLTGPGLWLAGFAVVYWVRVLFGTNVLLKRVMPWNEVAVVVPWLAAIHATYAGLYVAAESTISEGALLVAAGIYILGSFLNTYSELQRKWFKNDPANKGKLYTKGLFRFSMHINYFGDVLLFSAWAATTASAWAFIVPVVMTLGFVFDAIPKLDKYLAERYTSEFSAYQKKTAKLIPFLY